jgi:transposase
MFSTVIMRGDNHVHVRHIMLDHFEKGWKATESARDINELFGEGTIGERMVQKWFKRFKDGDTSLKDEEGRGRRSDFDDFMQLSKPRDPAKRTTSSFTMTTLGLTSKHE